MQNRETAVLLPVALAGGAQLIKGTAMGTDTPTRGLAWLVHPVKPVEFFGSYWEKRPLAVKRAEPGYHRKLPGLAEVDGLITATVFGAGARTTEGRLVRTERDGTLVQHPFLLDGDGHPDVHHIYRSYDEGYTVVLNGLHRRSVIVSGLCSELEADFQCPVGANLYLTPRNAQGFRPHVDSHDVVIVQIHGDKQWRVGATPARPFPTVAFPGHAIDAVEDPRDYLLTPGDALYIPRGYAHEATTQLSSSLHLTVGIHPYTWADLLAECLRLVATENADLRRALPVGHLAAAIHDDDTAVLKQSIAMIASQTILEAARLSLGSKLLKRQVATTGHFASLDLAPQLTVNSLVERGFQGPCRVRVTHDRVVVDYPGNYLSVPKFLAPALEYAVNASGAFSVASVPGELSDSDRLEVVARLVSDGFLRIVSEVKDTRP
jgi:bifunctional lysine-specific demethylase and histidyl-hydroxylase NO66